MMRSLFQMLSEILIALGAATALLAGLMAVTAAAPFVQALLVLLVASLYLSFRSVRT